jgi:outer membrane receptor protein involved in Fe transport
MSNRKLTHAVRIALVTAGAAAAGLYGPVSAAQEQLQEIIVTGSRIVRTGAEEVSATTVVGAEEFALSTATNVEQVLNKLPQIIPATQENSNNPGGGVATVNLRNIGTQRTLVLVNGRRFIAYDANGVVDLNTIPAALVERVDVVTGGRSAVYGSDAIAGVVNYILKRNFEGVELNGTYRSDFEGDAPRYDVNATMGGNFADGRGNVVLNVGYLKRDPMTADKRKFTEVSFSQGPAGLFPGGSSLIPELRLGTPGLNAALGLPGSFVKFDQSGNASAYNASTDLYNFAPDNYILVPQERWGATAMARYEINDHARPYLEATVVNNRVEAQLAPTPIGNTTPGMSAQGGLQVHVYSPFLAPNVRAALQAIDATDSTPNNGYVSGGGWGSRLEDVGPRAVVDDRNAYRFVTGLEGDIVGDWTYDAFYQFGRTRNTQEQIGNVAISRFLAATRTRFTDGAGNFSVTPFNQAGLPNNGAGELVCAAGAPSGCVPLNIYGPNRISPEAARFISIGTINAFEAETTVVGAGVTNANLWDIGAGPMGVALGVEYREESARFQPDQFLSSGDVAGFNAGQPTRGGYHLTEYYGELAVPLLKDVTGAKSLEANAAVRFSDYSNEVGGVTTWAAGLMWAPIDDLRFRAQFQRAIRGPSVNELFLGRTVSFDGASDPCQTPAAASPGTLRDTCIATGVPAAVVGTAFGSGSTSFPGIRGGNPDLKEESSDTYTVGLVLQPSALPNFSMSLDYYNIEIDDVIARVGTQNIVELCYNRNLTSYCSQVVRDPVGEFQSFLDLNQNAASLETEGLDLVANYRWDLGFGLFGTSASSLNLQLYGTYVLKNDYFPVVGVDLKNECAGAFGRNCGQPDPEWRHSLRATWSTGPLDVSLFWRYLDAVTDDDPSATYVNAEKIDAESYFDMSFRYAASDKLSFTLGLFNLADNKDPTPLASSQQGGNGQQSNTYPGTYDVIGRSYSLSAKFKF